MLLLKKSILALALLASLLAVYGCGAKDVSGGDGGDGKSRNELTK
jgi:hypothetical protein